MAHAPNADIFDLAPPSQTVVKLARQAVQDFALISPGDRIAVGMSGGKDSLMLAVVLRELSRHGDLDFRFQPVHLDQAQPGFDRAGFEQGLAQLGLECAIIREDTHSVVQAELSAGQIPCSLCSRMRRGILNRWCRDHGFTKLAMGHHLDDAIETFFLNLLFGRRLDPLKPSTPTADGEVTTIRPLILVEERKIIAWAVEHDVTVVDCPVCDTYPESKRRDLKHVLQGLSDVHGDIHASVRAALYESRDI